MRISLRNLTAGVCHQTNTGKILDVQLAVNLPDNAGEEYF